MKEYYTIGEVADIYNVSTDTLRYYDKIDLLKPWVKGENGYRYYSKAQFEIISTIMLLRSMGTPVIKLKDALNNKNADAIIAELTRYSSSIEKEIERLTELKKDANRLEGYIKSACYDENVRIDVVPEMWMFSKPFGTEDELDIKEILEVNRLAKKEWTTRAGIVSTVTKDNLLAGCFHQYDRYGYISETDVEVDSPYLSKLPQRLCVITNAKVNSLDHLEMDAAYIRALDYVRLNHYKVVGDAIERNVLDLYAGTPKNPTMYFEIYIPVEKD